MPEAKLLEHGADRLDGARSERKDAGLLDGGQTAVGLEIALEHEIVLELLAVKKGRIERIVVFQDRAEPRAYEVGAGDEKGHDLGPDADLGFGRTRVIAGGAFEIEPDGD